MPASGGRPGGSRVAKAVAALLGACMVSLLAWQTSVSVRTLSHFGEDTESGAQSESPYENVQAGSAASAWLTGFIASPDGGEGWQVGDVGGYPALLDGVSCSPGVGKLGVRPMLYASSRSGAAYVSAFVFPPGYAASAFDTLVEGVSSCLGEGESGASGSREWQGGQYALFQSGSVVVGVSGASDWRGVRGRSESLLLAGGCVSLSESASDSVRSPYYDKSDFTGLVESQNVGPSIVDPGSSGVSLSVPALAVPSVGERRFLFRTRLVWLISRRRGAPCLTGYPTMTVPAAGGRGLVKPLQRLTMVCWLVSVLVW